MTGKEDRAKAQRKFCEEKKYPMFMPSNGSCWWCGKDVTARRNQSEEEAFKTASTTHITGCPHCHRSFCD